MGLVCHKKNYLDKNGICIKFSSLENREKTIINLFACKSGFIGNKGICSNVYPKGISKEIFWIVCKLKKIIKLKNNILKMNVKLVQKEKLEIFLIIII